MFCRVTHFNQPLNSWNVSNVKIMYYMFCGCLIFNQPLDLWDVSNVKNMNNMFYKCKNFNQPIQCVFPASLTYPGYSLALAII